MQTSFLKIYCKKVFTIKTACSPPRRLRGLNLAEQVSAQLPRRAIAAEQDTHIAINTYATNAGCGMSSFP
jgi:hypothetical protein